jgi:hypothetical protein
MMPSLPITRAVYGGFDETISAFHARTAKPNPGAARDTPWIDVLGAGVAVYL